MTTKEFLIERINKIIIETSGVNDALDLFVFSVGKKLTDSLRKIKYSVSDDGLLYDNVSLTENFEGKEIKVYCTFLYFEDDEQYNDYIHVHGPFNSYSYQVKNRLFINTFLITIGQTSNFEDFYDSIYHELEHLFQSIKMEKNFDGVELNAYIRSKITSKDVNERCIAELLYATRNNEQDAMVNGMWGSIKNKIETDTNFNGDIDGYILNSEACRWLKKLYKNLDFLKKSKDTLSGVLLDLKQFNINYGRLISIAKRGIKRFEQKIALVTRRIKQKYIKEYHVHQNINTKTLNENKNIYCLKVL